MLKGSTSALRTAVHHTALEPSTIRVGYAMSPLLDFRRQKLRKGWQVPLSADAEFTVFPNCRHGRDYDLNWEFNAHQVTPCEEAYRNLHLRGLQMLVHAQSDAQKTVRLTTDEPNDHEVYYLQSANLASSTAKTISPEAWKAAIRQTRMDLSFQPEVFMHDSLIGSSRSASAPARLIFNSASAALHLHTMTPPIPAGHPSSFKHEIIGWMLETSQFKFSKERFGITSDNFTLVDTERRRFITVGKTLTQNMLRTSLSAVASGYLTGRGAQLLPCDAVVQGDASGLVFGLAGAPASEKAGLDLFAARETIWGPHGLSRAWDSVSLDHVPSSAKRGDVYETVGGATRFTTKLASGGKTVGAPKIAVFLATGKDAQSLAEIAKMKDAGQAVKFLQEHGAAQTEEFYGQLEARLSENHTECYVINYQDPAKLPKLLADAFNGKVKATFKNAPAQKSAKKE